MKWSRDPKAQLRIGEKVTEALSVGKAEFKKGMVFVHQNRDLYPGVPTAVVGEAGEDVGGVGEWAVKEVRTHVFREEVEVGKKVQPSVNKTIEVSSTPSPAPDYTFTYTPTSPLLFRYSALTFNAHKIHYDRPFTQTHEAQPDLLVHGPLTATLLIELAAVAVRNKGRGAWLEEFEYRATSPVYVDREVRLMGWWDGDGGEGRLELRAEQEGRVGMKATAIIR